MIQLILKNKTGFNFVSEHKFHEKRRWKFDFANIETLTAIEIEGGAFANGRHTRGKGFVNDMEKYNNAVLLGWVVLRFTPSQMNESATYDLIKQVLNNRKNGMIQTNHIRR